MMRQHSHATHSALVRHWRAKEMANWAESEVMKWKEGPFHALMSPFEGHLIRVTFAKYPGHPDFTRVRATNWRAEYEPNGIYATTDARMFYRTLLDAGF